MSLLSSEKDGGTQCTIMEKQKKKIMVMYRIAKQLQMKKQEYIKRLGEWKRIIREND